MFLAIIWASLFPTVEKKYCFPDENVSSEKSQLLKHDKKITKESHEKTHGSLTIRRIGFCCIISY